MYLIQGIVQSVGLDSPKPINKKQKQLTDLRNKKNKLEERYAIGDIELEIYTKFLDKIEGQLADIEVKFDYSGIGTSNFNC